MKRGMFDYEGSFYHYTGKVCDIMILSILWLLGSLPVITVGASFSALYAAASRSVRRNIGSVVSEYWKSYKRELKKSMLLWGIFAGAIFILLLNLGIIWGITDGLFRLFLLMLYGMILSIVITAMSYTFPALSRFEMEWKWFIKLSFYMVFRNLHISVITFLLLGVGYVIALSWPWTIIVLPGLLATSISSMMDPVLERHEPKEEQPLS